MPKDILDALEKQLKPWKVDVLSQVLLSQHQSGTNYPQQLQQIQHSILSRRVEEYINYIIGSHPEKLPIIVEKFMNTNELDFIKGCLSGSLRDKLISLTEKTKTEDALAKTLFTGETNTDIAVKQLKSTIFTKNGKVDTEKQNLTIQLFQQFWPKENAKINFINQFSETAIFSEIINLLPDNLQKDIEDYLINSKIKAFKYYLFDETPKDTKTCQVEMEKHLFSPNLNTKIVSKALSAAFNDYRVNDSSYQTFSSRFINNQKLINKICEFVSQEHQEIIKNLQTQSYQRQTKNQLKELFSYKVTDQKSFIDNLKEALKNLSIAQKQKMLEDVLDLAVDSNDFSETLIKRFDWKEDLISNIFNQIFLEDIPLEQKEEAKSAERNVINKLINVLAKGRPQIFEQIAYEIFEQVYKPFLQSESIGELSSFKYAVLVLLTQNQHAEIRYNFGKIFFSARNYDDIDKYLNSFLNRNIEDKKPNLESNECNVLYIFSALKKRFKFWNKEEKI